MNKAYRRYEVLIPLRFNDGQEVPDELVGATLLEIRESLGAVSLETQIIQGQWQHAGQTYFDEVVRAFVDVRDTPTARSFFRRLKPRLKKRFKQLDIWVTTYPIEII
jgi:hypothetical protein